MKSDIITIDASGLATFNNELTLKWKRATKKDYGHTQVFLNDKYLGYIIRDISKYRTIGHNFHFVSKSQELGLKSFAAISKEVMIAILNQFIKNIELTS